MSKGNGKRSTGGLILDVILTFCTGGLWLIWILIRYLRNNSCPSGYLTETLEKVSRLFLCPFWLPQKKQGLLWRRERCVTHFPLSILFFVERRSFRGQKFQT